MKFFVLKRSAWATLLASAALVGCGGGGSGGGNGGGSPSNTPVPTAIAPTNSSVLVQLRDTAGDPVDGIVTIGGRRRATTAGDVTFTNVSRGQQTASAEVNGQTFSQTFLATISTVTVQIRINPAITPVPGGTVPVPPINAASAS